VAVTGGLEEDAGPAVDGNDLGAASEAAGAGAQTGAEPQGEQCTVAEGAGGDEEPQHAAGAEGDA
jgi:hypothetical protein